MSRTETEVGGSGGMFGFARSSMWALGAYIAGTGAAFAVSIIVGRALGPQSFGVYSYYLWFLRLLPAVLALGIPNALTKHVSEHLGAGEVGTARGLFRFAWLLHAPIIGIAAGGGAAFVWMREADAGFALVVGIGAAAALMATNLDGLLTGLRRFDLLAKLGVANGVAQVTLAVVGIRLGLPAEQLIALQCAAFVLHALLLWAVVRHLTGPWPVTKVPADLSSRFLRFAGVMAAALVLDAFLFGRPEVFFLDLWRSEAEVGYYNAALRLFMLAAALPTVAARVLVPEFASLVGAGRRQELAGFYQRVCKVVVFVSAPLALGGAAVSGGLVRLFFGDTFVPAAGTAAILLAGSLATAIAAPASAAILTGPRPRIIVEVGTAVVAFNLLLDVLLIPGFGAPGAAWATVASQLVAVGIGVVICQLRYGLPFPFAASARLLAAAGMCALAARGVLGAWDGVLAFPGAIAVGAGVYLVAAIVLRGIGVEELRELLRREATAEGAGR